MTQPHSTAGHRDDHRPATDDHRPARDDDRHGGLGVSRRKVVGMAVFLVFAAVALYYLVPRIAGLDETWTRIEHGDPYWLLLALVFAILSYAGYGALFRGVFVRAGSRVGWRESYEITLAGAMATRLFAAGGAGGIALTAWALRKSGMSPRQVADKSVSYLVLTYSVYALALVVFGFGLAAGLFPGASPFALTIPPALVGLAAFVLGLAIAFVPTDFERRVSWLKRRRGRIGRWGAKLANVPAAASAGIRDALGHLRSRDPALLGAVAFWAFQIAVLWAAFRAFGDAPPLAVLVLAFFVGMFGNLLPIPGGVGGVEGGMIGALAAFGVEPGLAVVAVLVYRLFIFWLPMLPGLVAYFQLLRTVERWQEEHAQPGTRVESGARLTRPAH